MLWHIDGKGKQVSTELSKFIRKKILRGWPNTPLLNHDKTYCQVPKEEQLTKWIDEYNDDFAHILFNEIVKHQSDRQIKRLEKHLTLAVYKKEIKQRGQH